MLRGGMVVCVALVLTGCACGLPSPDAGASDGGGPDAAEDAGLPDAGNGDAGTPDAGSDDAGAPDAGNDDAGTPDAGSDDAGTADAGDSDGGALDSGTTDGGRRDGGTPDGGPDLCDGDDNDGDGLVDVGPDGGVLTEVCPLDAGVCAGGHKTCVGGTWSACDYGAAYEMTEASCDGLDNDCDGVADLFPKRVVLLGDAGFLYPGTLLGGEFEQAQIIPLSDRILLSLPDAIVTLSHNLAIEAVQVFPSHPNGWSYLFANGSDWIRVSNAYFPGPTSEACTYVHAVNGDGGFQRESDGGALNLGVDCHPLMGGRSFGAIEVSDGWLTAGACGPFQSTDCNSVAWTWTGRDGGYQRGIADGGGPPPYPDWVYAYSIGSSLFVASTVDEAGAIATIFQRLSPATRTLDAMFETDAGFCRPTTASPFTYSCSGPAIRGNAWFGADGGELAPRFFGWPLPDPGPGSPFVAVITDGGFPNESPVLAMIDGGAWVPLAELDTGKTAAHYFRGRMVAPRKLLLLYPENLTTFTCPNCQVGDLAAQYVCLPP